MKIITVGLVLCSWAILAQGNVGIGTTTPQAKLDVDGGNVRFSEYGTNLHLGTPEYLLGVEADGDIVEIPAREENRGLQFYGWDDVDDTGGNNNMGNVGIDVTDIRSLTTSDDTNSGAPFLGTPGSSGLYTGPLLLSSSNDPSLGGHVQLSTPQVIRPSGQRYVLIFKGTLEVNNAGAFTFLSQCNDGARIIIDDAIVLNEWYNGDHRDPPVASDPIFLTRGKHEVEFWYYENRGADRVRFFWGLNPDGYTPDDPIEATQFFIE